MIPYVLFYYLLINILLFAFMGIDKGRAKNKEWRVRENSLFFLSALGGCIGGLCGMFYFHHKTQKPIFYMVFLGTLVVHIAILYMIFQKL